VFRKYDLKVIYNFDSATPTVIFRLWVGVYHLKLSVNLTSAATQTERSARNISYEKQVGWIPPAPVTIPKKLYWNE